MRPRSILVLVFLGLWTVVLSAAALAHEKDKDVPARTLILQAIALLRGQPDQVAAIEDKMHDAFEADDTEGVDLDLVRQADEAFEEGDLHRAWDLLEMAIGVEPHRVVVEPSPGVTEPPAPAPPGQVVLEPTPEATASPGVELPTPTAGAPVLHETALERGLEAPKGTAGPVLLGVAGLLALLGTLVAVKLR